MSEILGSVKLINPEQQVSASFRKRELVVTTDEQYPQHILIEFAQDKCDILNSYKEGDVVKVSINIRGCEWVNPQGETKYFNSIQGWRIERHTVQRPADAYTQAKQPELPKNTAPATTAENEPDDLPF